jgi:multimeric flavodoxin WrbA
VNTATLKYNKALVLYGSPHKDGHTAKLLALFQETFPLEYRQFNLYEMNVRPCIDCKVCAYQECPYNSDDMGIIIDEIKNADIIICATPIYFNHVPASFKAMMDRCQQFYLRKKATGKTMFEKSRLGILLTTAGSKDKKVTDAIYNVFMMLFRCFEAEFVEHIAVENTDNTVCFKINKDKINHIKNFISKNGGIDNEFIKS